MSEVTKETVTTQTNDVIPVAVPVTTTYVEPDATNYQTVEYLIYFLFGALEILLAFRLVLKLTGASLASDFVNFIYNFSGIFVSAFEGIFRTGVAKGVETTAVFEPATLIAMLVYSVVAIGIVKLVRVASGKQQAS